MWTLPPLLPLCPHFIHEFQQKWLEIFIAFAIYKLRRVADEVANMDLKIDEEKTLSPASLLVIGNWLLLVHFDWFCLGSLTFDQAQCQSPNSFYSQSTTKITKRSLIEENYGTEPPISFRIPHKKQKNWCEFGLWFSFIVVYTLTEYVF